MDVGGTGRYPVVGRGASRAPAPNRPSGHEALVAAQEPIEAFVLDDLGGEGSRDPGRAMSSLTWPALARRHDPFEMIGRLA